jgi:p21-activated kinase 1
LRCAVFPNNNNGFFPCTCTSTLSPMTSDSHTPSRSSSRISRGALYRSSTKGSAQSQQLSISSSSVQTTSTVTANFQPPFDFSGLVFPPSVSSCSPRSHDAHKSCDLLETSTFLLRNKSQYNICTIPESECSGSSSVPSTPEQKAHPLSLPSVGDRDASDPFSVLRASLAGTLPFVLDNAASSASPGLIHYSSANGASLNPHVDPGPPPDNCPAPTGLNQISRELYGDSPTAVSSATTTSFSPPAVRKGTASRSRTGAISAKAKKGVIRIMGEFLRSNKSPELGAQYDLTNDYFNSSTDKSTGLPRELQQLLQDSGISGSDQEKNALAVMEIISFCLECNIMYRTSTPGSTQ